MPARPIKFELGHRTEPPIESTAKSTSMSNLRITDEDPIVRFLIGGVQKAGTTALHKMLTIHPDIFLPEQKELHFFDTEEAIGSERPNYDSYHQHFLDHTKGQLCGEATPSYVYLNSAMDQIKAYNPSMKWIVLLRHPATRAFSHWNMQRSRGIEPLNFIDALQAEPNRINTLPTVQSRRFCYADRSKYSKQIKQLLSSFDRKLCLFLTSDQLIQNTTSSLLAITNFLEISECPIEPLTSHVGSYENTLSTEELKKLTAVFAHDIELTEQLTQLNLNHWK